MIYDSASIRDSAFYQITPVLVKLSVAREELDWDKS